MTQKKRIIIFGNGGIAQVAHYYFEKDSNYEVTAFTVDRDYITTDTFENKPLIAFDTLMEKYPPSDYIIFIALSYASMNKLREEKYNKAKKMGYDFATYISSKSDYLSQFPPGQNCFILEGCIIQPFVKIGNNITLWSGTHIGHHSVVEDHNFFAPRVAVSGNCIIKSNCFLGINSTIHNNIIIERETLVAAGAVINRNTVEKGVYLPARTTLIEKQSQTFKL